MKQVKLTTVKLYVSKTTRILFIKHCLGLVYIIYPLIIFLKIIRIHYNLFL